MRTLSPAILQHYQARSGRRARLLIWITARNRTTNAPESIGFWTGDDHADFTIGGEVRTYYGAGSIIEIEPITYRTGLRTQTQRITLSPIDPAVQTAIRQYEPRLGGVELHLVDFHPVTGALIDAPSERFEGTIDKVQVITPEAGGQAQVSVEILGAAEKLRRPLVLKKSDESFQSRRPGDRIRRYTDVTGVVDCYWGELKRAAPEPTTPADPVESTPNEEPR